MGIYIKENFTGKEARALRAKQHTKVMELNYSKEIGRCISLSKIYDEKEFSSKCLNKKKMRDNRPTIIVEDIDSVGALYEHKEEDKKIAVLNFASYLHPGGMFLKGSKAQEECLCHESFLFNVLSSDELKVFYEHNAKNRNNSLYTNRAIYSPSVLFRCNLLNVFADVITCAAPNKDAAMKYRNVSEKENYNCLASRIKFVLDIAADNGVDILILGAFGCGVFGQNPADVAGLFRDYLAEYDYGFSKVVFAIPKGNANYIEFEKVFE